MFYSHSILAKSGPFAHVWLAATWEKKVTRSMIFGTDIATVVESIANPAAPLALRLSANLLVGVVRISSVPGTSRRTARCLSVCCVAFTVVICNNC